jgi:hypothetical protein
MAALVRRQASAREHRQRAHHLTPHQAEGLWVNGMDQIIEVIEAVVRALKQTGQFPRLCVTTYARSPQGTTTYMCRGTLLSLKGLRGDGGTLEFEIDTAPSPAPICWPRRSVFSQHH